MKSVPILLFCGILLGSCNDTYVNHKIEFSKTGGCENLSAGVQLESNIAGDRYLFHQCLPENFTEKDYSVTRNGDTLVVSFPRKTDQPKAAFALTLDIDANPRYSFIRLGDLVMAIGEATP